MNPWEQIQTFVGTQNGFLCSKFISKRAHKKLCMKMVRQQISICRNNKQEYI